MFEAGQPCGTEANMAKLLASEASWGAADMCVQTHGGFGFAEEYDIERKFRETRLYQVAPIRTNLILVPCRRARARPAEVLSDAPARSTALLVVSLEQAVAAPYCTSRLADAGARVIKIERRRAISRASTTRSRMARAPISSGSTAASRASRSTSSSRRTPRC